MFQIVIQKQNWEPVTRVCRHWQHECNQFLVTVFACWFETSILAKNRIWHKSVSEIMFSNWWLGWAIKAFIIPSADSQAQLKLFPVNKLHWYPYIHAIWCCMSCYRRIPPYLKICSSFWIVFCWNMKGKFGGLLIWYNVSGYPVNLPEHWRFSGHHRPLAEQVTLCWNRPILNQYPSRQECRTVARYRVSVATALMA